MIDENSDISVERILIALLSVFALNSIINVLQFAGVITASLGAEAFDIVSLDMFVGPVKASVYWLLGVGVLWFVAHRLGARQGWVLFSIGLVVSVAMTVLFSGFIFRPFWFVMNAAQAALMGWVLWRLAYQAPASERQPSAYHTTVGGSILAMLCGSVVGGSVTMVILVVTFIGSALGEFGEVMLLVMGFWLGGVFTLGGIPFLVLHSLGLRRWYGMTLVGAAAMLLVSLYAFGGFLEPEMALVMAATGSVVGWIIWRVAYRRAPLER